MSDRRFGQPKWQTVAAMDCANDRWMEQAGAVLGNEKQ